MQPLASSFRKDQFDFTLVNRAGRVALFQKSKLTGYQGYEVVLIQVTPERTFPDGRVVAEHEAMPGSETWGRLGWSYSTQEAAEKRFNSLV